MEGLVGASADSRSSIDLCRPQANVINTGLPENDAKPKHSDEGSAHCVCVQYVECFNL